MAVIVIFIYIKKGIYFVKRFYIHKNQKSPVYVQNFLIFQLLRALLRNKMEFCIFEKVNNSKVTKLCANLLNNCFNKIKHFSALHSSMTKLCSAPFKCENNLKIG